MDVTPLITRGTQLITGYGGGAFRIGTENWTQAVIVLPQRTLPWSGEVTQEALAAALEAEIELLLFGMGAAPLPVSSELRSACRARHIALEPMDTGAACRTYNVLVAEGRRVAAALRIV